MNSFHLNTDNIGIHILPVSSFIKPKCVSWVYLGMLHVYFLSNALFCRFYQMAQTCGGLNRMEYDENPVFNGSCHQSERPQTDTLQAKGNTVETTDLAVDLGLRV